MRRTTSTFVMLCTLAAIGTGGCSHRAPENVEFEPGAPTADGLRQVKDVGGPDVFLRPGIQMKDFSQILIDPFMVSYANPRGAPDGPVRTLDSETERRLADVLRNAFIQQMQASREFERVEQPGPEAVRVQGWLYDLVVEEPPTDDPRNFPLCFAELTVILTVRNSETAHALARVSERVRLSCAAKHPRFQTAQWHDVRRAVKPWAVLFRRWLEDLREIPPVSS